jgi:hypothetical protein
VQLIAIRRRRTQYQNIPFILPPMVDNDDSYEFMDREEIEFSHDGQYYTYWFLFRQATIALKGGPTGTTPGPQEAEVTLHPGGGPEAISKAILVLYKAKTSGNIQIQGFMTKLIRILSSSFTSGEILYDHITEQILAFKGKTPIATERQVLKFLEIFPPRTVAMSLIIINSSHLPQEVQSATLLVRKRPKMWPIRHLLSR